MNWTQLNSAFTLFLSLLVEAVPFLMLGVLFSGVLQFFVDERRLVRMMPRNAFLGALFGSCIGFLFPVCECGNVPVARRLLMQGVPSSVAIGFLLAAPTINPIVFWATWTAFRDQPEIVFLRIGCSLVIAVLLGWVFSVQNDLRPMLQPAVARAVPVKQGSKGRGSGSQENKNSSTLLQSGTYFLGRADQPIDFIEFQTAAIAATSAGKPFAYKLSLMLESMIQEMRELGGVLVLGSAIAAMIQAFVPREAILALGQGPVTSILAMMLLAAVVSICSTVDAFFALSFSSLFTTGSLLAFLVYGPMIDLKGIGLMMTIFKPRAIFYLFALAGQLTFLFALLVNLYGS
ncbi:putative permease [Leptolyngbyaceae cyanobacterium JSC-12]|nr:putative permease [Leptolyngbyaceae cyanobacterium JSC-12]